MIDTICEHCVFATKTLNTSSFIDAPLKVQTGCYFNRLETFKKIGVKVEKEGGYYKIHGRACNRCFIDNTGRPITELAELAVSKTRVRFDLVVTPQDVSQLKLYVEFANKLTPKPDKLIVLNKNNGHYEYTGLLTNSGLKWELIAGINKEPDLDDAIDKTESPYFWILDYYGTPFELPKSDTPLKLDKAINDDMTNAYCIYGRYGVFVDVVAFRYWVAKSENLVGKFLDINHKYELNLPKHTFEWGEICTE